MNFTNEKLTTKHISNPDIYQLDHKELLAKKIESLKQICAELNPYETISDEMKEKLNSVGIVELNNPFHLTNTLIIMLEDAIEEYQSL